MLNFQYLHYIYIISLCFNNIFYVLSFYNSKKEPDSNKKFKLFRNLPNNTFLRGPENDDVCICSTLISF